MSQKNCAKFFLSELCQISINCENFWHNDDKEDKLTCTHILPHLICAVMLTRTWAQGQGQGLEISRSIFTGLLASFFIVKVLWVFLCAHTIFVLTAFCLIMRENLFAK